MVDKNEAAIPNETSRIASLSSPKSLLDSAEPTLMDVTSKDDSTNLQQTRSVNFEAPIEQASINLSLNGNKGNVQGIPIEPKVPTGDFGTLSSQVDSSGLRQKDVTDGLPSASNEVDESKNSPNNSTAPQSLSEEHTKSVSLCLVKSTEHVQATPTHNFQVGDSNSDVQKVALEKVPAIPMEVKEDKTQLMPRYERQMSLQEIQQKAPAPTSRLNSRKYLGADRGFVDTTAHIESVRVAATRFGGSVNWKAHRSQAIQGNENVALELDRLKKEVFECKQQAESAEAMKVSVLNERESTKRLIEGMKHAVERAQAKEADAKEDLEFAQLMVKELQVGVASDDTVAGVVANKQFKIVQEQREAVLSRVKSIKDEFRNLKEDYDSLTIEQDISIRKAQVALEASKEAEKQVEELALELNKLKGMLDSAHAEEQRIGTSVARDEDCLTWETELQQAEEELKQLDQKLSSVKDMKSKLETSSSLLLELNAELAAYMEAKLNEEAQEGKKTHGSMQEVIVSPRNELEELKMCIDKAREKVSALKAAAVSLKSELEKEKAALANMQQMEGMASITVSSLKVEIGLTQQELEAVWAKEKVSRDKIVKLPKMLQDAAKEADKAKSVAVTAQEEVIKAKEEAEQAKAGLRTMEFRLQAVMKEIEAAKESERMALNAIKALAERKVTVNIEEPQLVMLDLLEYTSLSEKSCKGEELGHDRTAAAIVQAETAKESDPYSLLRLSEIYKALEEQKQALRAATERADKGTEDKLAMDQELRKWRAENGQRRKAAEAAKAQAKPSNTAVTIVERKGETKGASKEDSYALVHPMSDTSASSAEDSALHLKTKAKKLSFFRCIIMFLARRRLKAMK